MVSNGTEIGKALAMTHNIIELAPLALAAIKRFVNDHIWPRGPTALAARFGAEPAAVRDSADAVESYERR
jgi:hypothetical protein